MSHISTDHPNTNINTHVIKTKDDKNNTNIDKDNNLIISNKSSAKNEDTKEKKLSLRNISCNTKVITELYDTVSPEFLARKKHSSLISTRHIQKYDAYC